MGGSPAPALDRGIKVLQLLEDKRARSLEEITNETGFPKSSLVRLLETLSTLGLVLRDPVSRKYTACVMLLPIAGKDASFEERIRASLQRLADKTQCTAEWYVDGTHGMVLTLRAEPRECEVRVTARVGFLRPWTGELEAVNAIAQAFIRCPNIDLENQRTYLKDGVRELLTAEQVKERVKKAKINRSIIDRVWNSNGVRRSAVIVTPSSSPYGILAIAESMRPNPERSPEELLQVLLREAEALSN